MQNIIRKIKIFKLSDIWHAKNFDSNIGLKMSDIVLRGMLIYSSIFTLIDFR